MLLPYQREFIELSLSQKVLKFADFSGEGEGQPFFTLKSGRHSPYFFNAGLFSTGSALAKLGKFYAQAIVNHRPLLEFDVVFGPAYKVQDVTTTAGSGDRLRVGLVGLPQ